MAVLIELIFLYTGFPQSMLHAVLGKLGYLQKHNNFPLELCAKLYSAANNDSRQSGVVSTWRQWTNGRGACHVQSTIRTDSTRNLALCTAKKQQNGQLGMRTTV